MGETFINTTVSFYNETVELNGKINELNSKVSELNGTIKSITEKNREDMAAQQAVYEDTMEQLMDVIKTSAIILSATDYENISIYVAGKARYLITEEGTDAEFKVDKLSVKGKIFRQEDGTFKFTVVEDKSGKLPVIQFDLLTKGIPVKIMGK